jgi:hypothetical protein
MCRVQSPLLFAPHIFVQSGFRNFIFMHYTHLLRFALALVLVLENSAVIAAVRIERLSLFLKTAAQVYEDSRVGLVTEEISRTGLDLQFTESGLG